MVAFIVIGTIIVVIGVFLPWLKGSLSGTMMSSGYQMVTGYELNAGLIGAGVGVLSGILGFLGSGKIMPRKVVGFLVVIASIVIFIISVSLLVDPGGSSVSVGPLSIRSNIEPLVGLAVTALGGIILFIGGLIAIFKSE